VGNFREANNSKLALKARDSSSKSMPPSKHINTHTAESAKCHERGLKIISGFKAHNITIRASVDLKIFLVD